MVCLARGGNLPALGTPLGVGARASLEYDVPPVLSNSVDVLVIATLPEELDALLAVTSGVREAWAKWNDGPYHAAVLDGHGGPLRVVSTRLTKMTATEAADAAATLSERMQPRCLAMCGVCAGHPEDTDLGDVVIGDRLIQHDEGKHTAEGFRGDLWPASLVRAWLQAAQDQAGPAIGLHGYSEPENDDWKWWFLERLLTNGDPLRSTALRRYIPDSTREERLKSLEAQRLMTIKGERCSLTPKGRKAVERRRVLAGTHATALPFHVHVGPICSGNAVEADGTIWGRLAVGGVRKVLAVEMEAAAIGRVAQARELPFAVAKGVMDRADRHKTDRFKHFAARASAEVLCKFLRTQAVFETLSPGTRKLGSTRQTSERGPLAVVEPVHASAPSPSPTDNPYKPAGTLPHKHPSYVRRACDDALTAALSDTPLIAVEGEPSTGKSSLLTRASAELTKTHRTCFLDLVLHRRDDARVFMQRLFRRLSDKLGRQVDDWPDLNAPAEPPLALILDEIGELTATVAPQLFPPLVHLTLEEPKVRVLLGRPVQAGVPPLDQWLARIGVTHPKHRDHWRRIVVPRFGAAEVDRLLDLLPPRSRSLARTHAGQILSLSGGLPVAVQRVCSALFDADVEGMTEVQLREILTAQESYER